MSKRSNVICKNYFNCEKSFKTKKNQKEFKHLFNCLTLIKLQHYNN